MQSCWRACVSPPSVLIVSSPRWALSVMYITKSGGARFSGVSFGKMKCDARADQLVTFARRFLEALSIKYRDLPLAARDQTGAFQLPGGIRDAWPLDAQHFGEQVLSDLQGVIVTAVAHHQHPTRQPLLEAMRAVACDRHQDLLEKGLDVGEHKISK